MSNSSSDDDEKLYKLVVMGGGGVGKSTLTIKLVSGKFLEQYNPTLEDSYRKNISIDNIPCTLDILDTAGQDEFAAMRDLWIRESKGFLLVYSIISSETFPIVTELYEKIIRIKEDELNDIVIVLAGNKCDLAKYRQIPIEDGQNLVNEWKKKQNISCNFFETSAKSNINNEECYYEIVRLLRKKHIKIEVLGEENTSTCCNIL